MQNTKNADINNILLIGVGPHSKRIYMPSIAQWGTQYNARICFGVDLLEKKTDIEQYFFEKNIFFPMHYINATSLGDQLPKTTERVLDNIVKQCNVRGVIIATEPLVHMQYARWAIKRGLHVLMDKPISTHLNVSTKLDKAKQIWTDYSELMELDKKAKKKYNGDYSFSLMAQRRFHPAFKLIRDKVKEVYNKTGCPVTSVQTFHCDGQWRMPTEIVHQHYHPYNQGYGKLSHSGYHTVDIVPWLMEDSGGSKINNVDIFTNFVRPLDFLQQIPLGNYNKYFKDFSSHNKYTQEEYEDLMADYGEIDAFSNIAFKRDDKTITLASNNLCHTGFAQRNWASAEGRDLYKGNGRVRQEAHIIEQGPFQSITYLSYQGEEVDPNKEQDIYDFGGEYHLDIHIFRNDKMYPHWKNHEKITINDINVRLMAGQSRGHQEDARLQCIIEFCRKMNKDNGFKMQSSLEDQKMAVMLMSGIYQSAVKRRLGENPLVNIYI